MTGDESEDQFPKSSEIMANLLNKADKLKKEQDDIELIDKVYCNLINYDVPDKTIADTLSRLAELFRYYERV